jgi:hypothetical protein
MSDEQIIYIGPEDDLTSVRERLEGVQSKKVTLVIPANTQLRSHVAWKLLYVRARELGKDVLIVSSDAQIRSVAHGVKFRVATSLEASSPAKPRPASRPSRVPAGAKSRSASTGSMRTPGGKVDNRGASSTASGRIRSFTRPDLEAESRPSQPEDTITEGLEEHPARRFGSSNYEARFDSAPSIHPLPPQQSDEAPDYLIDEEDVNIAREIREAALGGRQLNESPPEESPEKTDEYPSARSQPAATPRASHLPQIVDDPFAYMDDTSPSRMPNEQHGSVSMDHFATNEYEIQDAPDTPTDDGIEYQDDTGVFLPAAEAPASPDDWAEPAPYDEEEVAGPSSFLNVRPHSSSPRNIASRAMDDELEGDLPPPIENQPTRVEPSTPGQMSPPSSQKPAASTRRSVPLQPGTSSRRSVPLQPGASPRRSVPLEPGTSSRRSVPLQPGASSRRSTPLQPPAARDRAAMASPVSPPGPSRISQRPAARSQGAGRPIGPSLRPRPARTARAGRGRVILLAAAILLILLIGSLALFVPTASVVLTLQPHTYTHALNLVAHSGTQQNSAPGTVVSQLQTHTFTQSGTATASGTKQVGRAPATGSVTFTNNGKQPVDIPTGTIVSTPGGIQFATQADLVVTPPNNNKVGNQVPVPVQAVNKGDNGNLPAGTITVIPQTSLSAIAKNNNISASSLALQVTNSQPTTGGGLGTVHTILQRDLDAAQKSLSAQTQPAITAWLKQWTANGISSKPTINASLIGSPQDGQVVSDVSVPVTLSTTVSVLVVSNSNLQKAAVMQLDAFLQKDANYQDYTIRANTPQAVKISALKVSSNNATSLTISANATAQAVRAITQDEVRKEISGMTSKVAQEMLSQQPGIEHAEISVSPSADPWLPVWSANTHVVLEVGAK